MSRWVSTQESGISYDQASSVMFMRLFNYISGKNAQQLNIAMTAPVIVRDIHGQGPACENNFTMSFYIAPTSSCHNFVSTGPTLGNSEGFAKEQENIEEAQKLAAALPSSAKYVKDYFFTAGYDAPFKLFGRHNEVWLIAK